MVIIVKAKQVDQSRITGHKVPGRAAVGRTGSALRHTLNSHTDVHVNKSSSAHPCKYLSFNNMGHGTTRNICTVLHWRKLDKGENNFFLHYFLIAAWESIVNAIKY